MPPKRKLEENPNITVGRAKIRKRENGKQLVDKGIRKNVLLFLEKLGDEEAKNYSQPAFQAKLDSAVAGALDPEIGPEAFIDLAKYHPECPEVFGNKQAGQLMNKLLSLNDDERLAELQKAIEEQKTKLEKEQTNKGKVEKTLGYLQALIPLSQAGTRDLPTELEALASLGDKADAAWLYGILWTSCLQWMDARLRQLRSFGGHTNNKPQDPAGLKERQAIINTRLHGGDLRSDALLCSIKFGDHRHGDSAYDVFIKESFKNMYRLKVDDGLWLARNGQEISKGVDWPWVIGLIDKFVSMMDRVNTWNGKLPVNYKVVIKDRYLPFVEHVAALIKQADADPDWNISAADLTTLNGLPNQLYNDCKKWIQKGEAKCLWDTMGAEPKDSTWPHAGYLRDETSKAPRLAGQGAAAMTLRTQARVKYTA